ncbi:hypothetical protein Dsin_012968 [Dipteronia sinensis]|uniref:Reverse transcriptase domain-containing protein n=1 Tax=Dipteronia sinensis TaxID=43782 RepID=A0AAE0AJ29_9ROSI|nr:hypothetical protein Dsin_012968 [Dipteronia sinensis]
MVAGVGDGRWVRSGMVDKGFGSIEMGGQRIWEFRANRVKLISIVENDETVMVKKMKDGEENQIILDCNLLCIGLRFALFRGFGALMLWVGLLIHECFFRDRSKVRWLHDEDQNTSFFHASLRHRQYHNAISAIFGVLLEDRPTIRDHIISYYSDFFSSDVSRVVRDLSIIDDVISSLVTAVENAFLTSVPSTDDFHDTVFVMDVASGPGPDGFSGRFYQRCWDIFGSDVFLAIQDFVITGVIFSGLNSSFIVLFPKLNDSISIDQFQPIVLSNFMFKISSKILDDSLARVVAKISSPQQFRFIRDWHIDDCIALTSDCVAEEML